MNETTNLESSFRSFLDRLNKESLTQNEAKIILIGNNMFYGFLNVVFDFDLSDQNEVKIEEVQDFEKDKIKIKKIWKDINQTESKKQKTIKLTQTQLEKKKKKFSQSAEGGRSFIRSNFVPLHMYKNHFLCSVLSDLLIDLFMPQRSKHHVKFQRGRLTSAQGPRRRPPARGNQHPFSLV